MKDSLTEMMNAGAGATDWILTVSWVSVSLSLLTAIVCGAAIYLLYRYFYRGSFYNDNFNALLVLVTVITALVITTVSSNLALSLGMVGALSIVRFRAAIKDPLDVGFIFLAIAAGLTAGAGLYLVALLGTGVIAVVYIGLNFLRFSRPSYLVVVKYKQNVDMAVQKVLAKYKCVVKNKTFHQGMIDLTLETRAQAEVDGDLGKIKGVETVVKVEYNGDYLG